MNDDDGIVVRICASIRSALNDEQFTEFQRLVRGVREDNPEQLLYPRDIVALVGTALFNLGEITQGEIEQINKEIFGDQ